MGTFVTFAILLGLAYANAYVGIIGVRRRVRGGMRLQANDAGVYTPRHWGFEGFYRGLYVNALFAAGSTALLTLIQPGEGFPDGKPLLLSAAVSNLGLAFLVPLLVPSELAVVRTEER